MTCFTPHPYQQHAIRFIEEKPEAAIFLGMGLGKTVITLTALDSLINDTFQVRKALIVAPLRVARDTWTAEQKKWEHLKDLRVTRILGTPKQREAALAEDADVYVINRENIPWLVKQVRPHRWPFDMLVIDELTSFKNPAAQRFRALKKVRGRIERIVGLTGTPAPNSLMDLWAPFRLIDQGKRLGSTLGEYRQHYFQPGRRNGHIVYEWRLLPGAEKYIYEAVSDITLSMKTCDFLELPEVTTSVERVRLPAKAKAAYRRFKEEMVADLAGGVIEAGSAGVLSGKLQQLSSGAIYRTDDGDAGWQQVHTAKIDALQEIIEKAAGNTVLVAYWFKHEAERVLEAIPGARRLDSGQDMRDWCAGKVPVGLIHPASAGHGLNLQSGGHILVWFTTPWSLELLEQANARLHRQGQTEPVSIVHILAEDTIDARVMRALETKSMTQQALLEAVKAEVGGVR